MWKFFFIFPLAAKFSFVCGTFSTDLWPYLTVSEPVGTELHINRRTIAFCRLIWQPNIGPPSGTDHRWMVENRDQTRHLRLLQGGSREFFLPGTIPPRWRICNRSYYIRGIIIRIALLTYLDTIRNCISSTEFAPFDSSEYFCFRICIASYKR